MTTTLGFQNASFLVDGVTDVQVTEAEQDTDLKWVREIRCFGQPVQEGGTPPIIATLRIKSETKANINLSAPALDF